jgi:murein DD-endopeptidase MepM/ murein hydrolase activator NlpD
MNRSSRYYLLRGLVVLIVGLVFILGYAVTKALQSEDVKEDDIRYVSYEILTDNVMPVLEQPSTPGVMKPYTYDKVEIGKSYYDYKADEANQEGSVIYYENTYIQNTGVDYTSKEEFDVNAIADGTVLSVTKDDIVGTTIKIEHSNNLIAVYQSVKDVLVKENDQVTIGQVIAKSGTNSIGSELGNHLHFELYQDNILVNPEEFFQNNQGN